MTDVGWNISPPDTTGREDGQAKKDALYFHSAEIFTPISKEFFKLRRVAEIIFNEKESLRQH